MRLINTTTIQLHEFFDHQIPLYAILSHRWEGAEVTFQDLNGGKRVEMKGDPRYAKILGCCAQAKDDGFEFAVCCSFLTHSLLLPILFRVCCSLPFLPVNFVEIVIQKPSTPCFGGIKTHKCATFICLTSLGEEI
jgi:hypothetical protein